MIVRLDAVGYNDLPQLRVWRNTIMEDGNVRQWNYLNELDQEDWWSEITRQKKHIMMKVLDEDELIIGVVGLCYIDWVRRSGEVSIYIGELSNRGKGYGKAALTALLDYGFKTVNLYRIWGEIFVHNAANIKLFESLGFQYEGTKRAAHFFNGQYVDSRMYSLLQHEWVKNV